MPSGKASMKILAMIVVCTMIDKWSSVDALPIKEDISEDIITGSDFLSILTGSDPSEEHLDYDINKKEAPRINNTYEELKNIDDDILVNSSQEHFVSINRNSRSNKEEIKDNSLKIELPNNKKDAQSNNDDLQAAGTSFYRDDVSNEHLKNGFAGPIGEAEHFDEDSPKIIGVRVTSSVAVGRGNKTPQVINPPPVQINRQDSSKNLRQGETESKFPSDNPTTWRPPLFRFINRDFYKGASSNRHTISTLPGPLIGANEDYIQQQKEREMRKKSNIHPYERTLLYQGHPREGQRPRSFSYSSVINTFGDPKLTTANDWSSTKPESVATEATAGYVTIINHGGDNRVDEVKDIIESEPNLKDNNQIKPKMENQQHSMSPLPIVYSEPAKIYSEPAKIYSEPSKVYGKPEEIYSEPAKIYSEPAKNYGEPAKIYGEPAKIYSEPSKIYSEPSKIYSQPASIYHPLPNAMQGPGIKMNDNETARLGLSNPNQPTNNDTKNVNRVQGRSRGPGEQNYEIDESVSVMTNGRTHGVQDKATDDGQKVGYVVEGRNFRKYRVEERTSDGFIVGEYGVVSHDDGSLRGVRYTADGATNPRLIYDALMKFLSL